MPNASRLTRSPHSRVSQQCVGCNGGTLNTRHEFCNIHDHSHIPSLTESQDELIMDARVKSLIKSLDAYQAKLPQTATSDKMLALTMIKLTGEAKQCLTTSGVTTYEQAKDHLLNMYCSTDWDTQELTDRVSKMRIRDNESLQMFGFRIQTAAKAMAGALGEEENSALIFLAGQTAFLSCAKADIRIQAEVRAAMKNKNLTELISTVTPLLRVCPHWRIKTPAAQPEAKTSQPRVEYVQPIPRPDGRTQQPIREYRGGASSRGRQGRGNGCYRCGRQGHYKRDCQAIVPSGARPY